MLEKSFTRRCAVTQPNKDNLLGVSSFVTKVDLAVCGILDQPIAPFVIFVKRVPIRVNLYWLASFVFISLNIRLRIPETIIFAIRK